MEAPYAARVFARPDPEARPGHMRSLRAGHHPGAPQAQTRPGRHSPGAHAALGILDKNAQESLGCRSHFAGHGRRRGVRPRQYPDPLPALPSCGNNSTAGADPPRQSSGHARRGSNRHPVEAVATCPTSAMLQSALLSTHEASSDLREWKPSSYLHVSRESSDLAPTGPFPQTCCTSARTLLTVDATRSSMPLASFTSFRLSADKPGCVLKRWSVNVIAANGLFNSCAR